MAKYVKFIILGAGAIGLLAFFMPLISINKGGFKGTASAYQIVSGLDKAQKKGRKAIKKHRKDINKSADAKEFVKDADDAVSAIKGIVMAVFLPALLLTLFGGIGLLRKKFGRVLASFSFIFGLIQLGIWALLYAAAKEGGAESIIGFGMHMLFITGLAGIVGGLMGLIKPDRGPDATFSKESA